ncbi:hypothetical protein LMG28614_05226 [Paraburkholderia ultramafica]|uniref:Uncharacterized protein n=1 Tax=Paraburkholderia ultramafica TaxID=1544867 RepID=A0A6S7BIC3_9BURK|nr:hypothetical protein [Paraburkholderia ultramafica]CAB3800609.1 hypothetical protein LMG28614_05226 [Paraburkholderia ultramafica]
MFGRTVRVVAVATALVIGAGVVSSADTTQGRAMSGSNKLGFPEGTATPSETCGACHKAIYRESSEGAGSDLSWPAMKLLPTSQALLNLPANASQSATAHAVAGIDPWPIEARRHEENGKICNVCHYPAAFNYPDKMSATIEKPVPRQANQDRGLTCASCHLTPDGKIRGPYGMVAPHETVADPDIRTSVACAYCHSEGKRIPGKQTQTFLEWREDFIKAGLGTQQCQDCHMPRTVRKLAEDFDLPPRIVARHIWTGGHSFQRVSSALNLDIVQTKDAKAELAFHVTNVGAGHSVPTGSNRRAVYLKAEVIDARGAVVASNEWMFAPWMLGRPDDRAFLEEDRKGPHPVATMQADAQGPHETIIRAGEERILNWSPKLAGGRYTVRATLIYDLNRYNDRAFKDDQRPIAETTIPIEVAS